LGLANSVALFYINIAPLGLTLKLGYLSPNVFTPQLQDFCRNDKKRFNLTKSVLNSKNILFST
jgi:hypothetical protein